MFYNSMGQRRENEAVMSELVNGTIAIGKSIEKPTGPYKG